MSRKPRVKRLHLPLTPYSELVISLRRFKTNKARRSKLKKQFVFRLHFLSVKEVAIVKTRRKKHVKKISAAGLAWVLQSRVVVLALLTLGIGGSLYFGISLSQQAKLQPIVAAQTSTNTIPPSSPLISRTLPRSEPTSIRIARLNISASIVPVGLQADGSMQIPAYELAGWYKLAPTPGELGPAIIVGHVDSPKGPAIFWRLRELQPGDIVEIARADQKTARFRVDKVAQFPSDNLPTQEIYGDINHAGVRLMTCSGTFDRQTRQYDQNIVAFGSLIL